MTNSKMNTTTLLTAALLAVGAIGFSSFGAHASSTSSLAQCKAYSRENVVKCCETVIRQQGAPAWFRDNNVSCGSAVSCSGGGNIKASYAVAITSVPTKYRCYVKMYEFNNQGKNRDGGERRGNQGGKD